jgi:hypothetical protein
MIRDRGEKEKEFIPYVVSSTKEDLKLKGVAALLEKVCL